ncbi:envelope glycoprotein [Simian immunodeficiency virus]|uniref:Envelope glycoprotein gp160 n=1 Tax=Simian immunodeficiency virus TaxID=11723 RepID=V5T9C8_SIV|nr:envelope glycoprotein [Simian immunodeficiency virus]
MFDKKYIRGLMIGIICIEIVVGSKYVTVYQGVPAWEEAAAVDQQIFCFSSSVDIQQVLGCLPPPPGKPVEQNMPNITESFDLFKNSFSAEVWSITQTTLEQRLRPCAKLSAYCAPMLCTEAQTNETTTSTPTTTTLTTKNDSAGDWDNTQWVKETWYECKFNSTAFLLKDRKELSLGFSIEDLDISSNRSNNTIRATMKDCKNYTVTQVCDHTIMDPVSTGFCAAPGYMFLRCDDKKWNGTGQCSNVTAVSCTHEFNVTVMSHVLVNASEELKEWSKDREGVWKNESGTFEYYWFPKDIALGCIRRGNSSHRNLNTANGAKFYYEVRPEADRWKGRCQFVPMNQKNMTKKEFAGKIVENLTNWLQNITEYGNITIKPRNGNKTSDPEATFTFLICHRLFFYCDASSLWAKNSSVMNCTIRKLVNSWVSHARLLYGPPPDGHLQCNWEKQPVIAFMGTVEKGGNETGCAYPAAPNFKHALSTLELGRYKLVKMRTTVYAPTDVKRQVAINWHHGRQKRGIFAFSILALLSGAGAAMGSASVALTIQAQSLLEGLVQQQRMLLKLVETQSALLQLTVWGVKNLQVRVATIESYLEEQAKLASIGCSNMQICRTIVPWNKTWGMEEPWQNYTWKQWYEQVANYTNIIEADLVEAYDLQEANEKKLAELGDWTNWFSGFGLFNIFKYVLYAAYVIGGIIAFRILMLVISCIRGAYRLRGFQRLGREPLSSQIRGQNQEWEQPDNGEELDSEQEDNNSRLVQLLKGLWKRFAQACSNGLHTLMSQRPETFNTRRTVFQTLWNLLVPRCPDLSIPETLSRWLRSATRRWRRASEYLRGWLFDRPESPA